MREQDELTHRAWRIERDIDWVEVNQTISPSLDPQILEEMAAKLAAIAQQVRARLAAGACA